MQKPNIAMSLLAAVGLGALFRQKIPHVAIDKAGSTPKHGRSEIGRAVYAHRQRKADFNSSLDGGAAHPGHIGVARKAHLGTLTIPGGRRGFQVRRQAGKGRKSVYRITG